MKEEMLSVLLILILTNRQSTPYYGCFCEDSRRGLIKLLCKGMYPGTMATSPLRLNTAQHLSARRAYWNNPSRSGTGPYSVSEVN